MQMFCTSLEPKTKRGQDADLSIMTALTLNNPGAKSLFDLGVRCKPRSETTRGMIAAFDSMLGGTIFDASQASSDDFETSEQNPFGDECYLRSCKGNTCAEKVKTLSAIIMTLSALYRLLADSGPCLVWQHNKICSRTTSIFHRPLFKVNYCPETVTMARSIFLHRQDMTKILFTCTASLNRFTACPLQPELGTPP